MLGLKILCQNGVKDNIYVYESPRFRAGLSLCPNFGFFLRNPAFVPKSGFLEKSGSLEKSGFLKKKIQKLLIPSKPPFFMPKIASTL
jgi:hypothetical protein